MSFYFKYFPALIFSSVGSAPSNFTAFTVSSNTSRETYPMEPGVDATFAITAPVLSNSLLYLHASSSFNSSSKAPLVPEPASRPTTTIGASFPPTSFQLVTEPS